MFCERHIEIRSWTQIAKGRLFLPFSAQSVLRTICNARARMKYYNKIFVFFCFKPLQTVDWIISKWYIFCIKWDGNQFCFRQVGTRCPSDGKFSFPFAKTAQQTQQSSYQLNQTELYRFTLRKAIPKGIASLPLWQSSWCALRCVRLFLFSAQKSLFFKYFKNRYFLNILKYSVIARAVYKSNIS